jgi:heme/copper-type cytochrome/quinol oxidase subunit 3
MEGVVIPYTAERRPDTGVSNGTLGIWLFLASEAMLFGALFSAYALLRTSATEWPVGREMLGGRLATINTVLLILSTMYLWRATRETASVRGRLTRSSLMARSSLTAAAFLAVKGFEYWDKLSHGLLPSSSTFLALYFTLTGFHAAHVLGGFIANAWAIRGMFLVGEAITAGRLKALALYWTFVDVVWLGILVAFYAL